MTALLFVRMFVVIIVTVRAATQQRGPAAQPGTISFRVRVRVRVRVRGIRDPTPLSLSVMSLEFSLALHHSSRCICYPSMTTNSYCFSPFCCSRFVYLLLCTGFACTGVSGLCTSVARHAASVRTLHTATTAGVHAAATATAAIAAAATSALACRVCVGCLFGQCCRIFAESGH